MKLVKPGTDVGSLSISGALSDGDFSSPAVQGVFQQRLGFGIRDSTGGLVLLKPTFSMVGDGNSTWLVFQPHLVGETFGR